LRRVHGLLETGDLMNARRFADAGAARGEDDLIALFRRRALLQLAAIDLFRERARRLVDRRAPLRARGARRGVLRIHAARRVVGRKLARVVGVDLLAVLLLIACDRLVGMTFEIGRKARLDFAPARREILRLRDVELAGIKSGLLSRLLRAARGE